MTRRKLALVVGVLALITVLAVVSVGAVFAQSGTPQSQATPGAPGTQTAPNARMLGKGFGFGWGFRGGDTATFDAVAAALNLTPTQLFEQLHSGKTLSDIATAQGVDLSKVQAAVNASRVQAMKDKITAAEQAGTITKDQGDWLLQGLDKGYIGGGKGLGFGFGFGGRGHGRGGMMRGFGPRGGGNGGNGNGIQPQPTPSTSSFGTTS